MTLESLNSHFFYKQMAKLQYDFFVSLIERIIELFDFSFPPRFADICMILYITLTLFFLSL